MFKNKIILVAGILVLLVAGYFGYKAMKPSAPSNLSVPPNTVIVEGNAFTPDTLNVKVGTKVTWTNKDNVDHTITSDDGTIDSGSFGVGKSFSFTFSKAGTYSYHCTIHPFMTGKIIVE